MSSNRQNRSQQSFEYGDLESYNHNCIWKRSYEEEHAKRDEAENNYIKTLKVHNLWSYLILEIGIGEREIQRDGVGDERLNQVFRIENLNIGKGGQGSSICR